MSKDAIRETMLRIGGWVQALAGWRRLGFAFACGAVSASGFPPLDFFPALLLGYAALVLLIDAARAGPRPVRGAAVIGWFFAFGQFLFGLHWIGYAFLVDPGAHLWQMPFALVSLTAGLALFGALSAGLSAWLWQNGSARHFIFAGFYAAAEWLRGHLFTGFPWNLPAYGWGASLAILQSASMFGAYGLSLLTVLLGASLADLFCGPRRSTAPATMLMLFGALWVYGVICLAITPESDVPGVRLRLVQPDIPQAEKYQPRFVMRNWERLIDLSQRPGSPNVIIWPEAAPPFPLARVPQALDEIARLTGRDKTLITGAERVAGAPGRYRFYNSLYIFGPGGGLQHVYDKFHLVPFGEYIPFAALLNRIGITKLTQGEAGFTPGDGPHVYALSNAPKVTPLICYEVIFPGAVTAAERPAWIVNVTDDSWFGPWAGPRQHLLIARVRAIEEALPIVRDANTGISAVIDPVGRVRARLGLDRTGVLDAPLPKALAPSLYASLDGLVFAVLLLIAAGAAFLLSKR
ncbi:MAG TPA: apolipoprotein N-acyltransferase [Rhizomicrobium sp.]|jgi:apolipoprotein N-acyltransferase|nr:apolipoprotein N-acyltransferase [Rhizomicrobium sp.]